jgi:hypothetical protein
MVEVAPLSSSDIDELLALVAPPAAAPPAAAPPAAPPAAAPPRELTLPSVGRQKSFIIEHADILGRETQLAILSIVMMEIGPTVVMDTAREVDINLDAVSEANEEVLAHIYNIVRARLESLNQRAGAGGAGPDQRR